MWEWAYEIIDDKSKKVVLRDTGFESESEAEYFANIDARIADIKNYSLRTYRYSKSK